MERTPSTKHMFAKMAALFVLLLALAFLVHGTASARSVASAQGVAPQVTSSCYVVESQWIWHPDDYNVQITRWLNTCTTLEHCEAHDQTFPGGDLQKGVKLVISGPSGSSTGHKFPFRIGDTVNTGGIAASASDTCSVSLTNS